MELREFMTNADESKTYAIGAAVGYLTFTTKEAFEKDIAEANEKCLAWLTKSIETTAVRMATKPEFAAIHKDSTLTFGYFMEADVKKKDKEREAAHKYLKKMLDRVKEWTPLWEREVKETYDLISTKDTVAVIISGPEEGKYLYKEEWEDAHDKSKANG